MSSSKDQLPVLPSLLLLRDERLLLGERPLLLPFSLLQNRLRDHLFRLLRRHPPRSGETTRRNNQHRNFNSELRSLDEVDTGKREAYLHDLSGDESYDAEKRR